MQNHPKQLSALLCAFVLLGLSACDPAVPDGSVTGECENLELAGEAYFNETMVPEIFEPYCSYCHWSDKVTPEERKGATEGLNYDEFESATSLNYPGVPFSTTWNRMSDRTMPPMGRVPSTEEMQMVLDWINCDIAARSSGDDDDSSR